MAEYEHKKLEELPKPVPKTLKVRRSKVHPALFAVVYTEGGVVPKELSGAYSRKRFAEEAIVSYLPRKPPSKKFVSIKGKDNGKSKKEDRV